VAVAVVFAAAPRAPQGTIGGNATSRTARNRALFRGAYGIWRAAPDGRGLRYAFAVDSTAAGGLAMLLLG
jgi:hypothetical protein